VTRNDNVVMTRTFSKLYGLAGCGWAGSMRPPLFAMCSTAFAARSTPRPLQQQVGAAAVRDRRSFLEGKWRQQQWMPWITEEIPQDRLAGG